jgi:glycosyltransferase involved in cell wall biosynthesis
MPKRQATPCLRAMRICLFASNDFAHDPRVARHAETLGKAGFEVTVVCTKSPSTSRFEKRSSYSISRVAVRMLQLFPVYFLLLGHWLAKQGRSINADAYVSNDLDTLLAGVLCAGFSRILVYDAHELWPDQFVGANVFSSPMIALLRIVESILVKRADAVITVNDFIASELAKRYGIRKPSVVLNVPRRETVKARSRREHCIVLYQGVYEPTRGLENVVRACPFLRRDVKLILRGYGSIENELRRTAIGFKNCYFEDPVPPDRLVRAASRADVGIVPYIATNANNYYASPNKLFEYIQAGLPVVASDLPFLRKIITSNNLGYLFDPEDPESIADAINRATQKENLPMLRANVAKVQGRYSWDEENVKLLDVMRHISV